MRGWLRDALSPEWSLDDLERATRAGEGCLARAASGEDIGVVVARDGPARNTACIPFVAIDPAWRYGGLGGEAALAVERALRESGASRVFAPVPEARGLAVYFWLRLGYAPLVGAEAPGPPTGLAGERLPGIWMVRDLP